MSGMSEDRETERKVVYMIAMEEERTIVRIIGKTARRSEATVAVAAAADVAAVMSARNEQVVVTGKDI